MKKVKDQPPKPTSDEDLMAAGMPVAAYGYQN
jgi:hypothetical protein